MKPYQPEQLPLPELDYARLAALIGPANADVARYDGLLNAVINPDVLLSPLTTREAVLSSRIEGTQATLDQVLEHEAGVLEQGEIAQDIGEIINYRRALALAREVVEERPITLSLVRQIHRVLMDSVRGQSKTPGEFRTDQNWIGRPGSPIEDASFVPPAPLVMMDGLEAWQRYLGEDDVDVLLQLAVMHAQFELLHPFRDGNGRIGRLLIPLFLYQKRTLSTPSFYLSEYLDAHRDAYYERLQAISRGGDWDGWIAFFLEAVTAQGRANTDKVRRMLALYDELKEKALELTRSRYAVSALDQLFRRPIFSASDFSRESGIPRQSALPLLGRLGDAGLVETVREASGPRATVLAFPALLEIVDSES